MSENVDNMVVEQLRIIREFQEDSSRRLTALDAKVSAGFADVQEEFERIDGRIDGLILMMGDFATRIAHTGSRLDSMDDRMGRLEARDD
jgi:hypothetical protein